MLTPRRSRPHRIGTLTLDVTARPPAYDRSYVHTASDGTQTEIFVRGEDRWHYIEETKRRMYLPRVPNDIAGRYALTFYDLSIRRGYRRFHDDYMLEDKHEPWDPWRPKHTYPSRRVYRRVGVIAQFPLSYL